MSLIWAVASRTIFTTNVVYYVEVVGLDPLQLTLLGTTLEVAYFLFEAPTGILADLYSRKLSIIVGYLLLGISFIIAGTLPMFIVIISSEIVRAIGHTFLSGALEAWLADEIGQDQLGKAFARGTQVMQIGGFAGIGLSVLFASIRLNLIFWVAGFLLIGLAIILFMTMPETNFVPQKRAGSSIWQSATRTLRETSHLLRTNQLVSLFFVVELFFRQF